jgi:hypothetical protein
LGLLRLVPRSGCNWVLTHWGVFPCTIHIDALVPRRSITAGVPGPRRNADDRDAGWFAPVATRRRPMLARLRRASPVARSVYPGGRPPGPPERPSVRSGCSPLAICGCAVGHLLRLLLFFCWLAGACWGVGGVCFLGDGRGAEVDLGGCSGDLRGADRAWCGVPLLIALRNCRRRLGASGGGFVVGGAGGRWDCAWRRGGRLLALRFVRGAMARVTGIQGGGRPGGSLGNALRAV